MFGVWVLMLIWILSLVTEAGAADAAITEDVELMSQAQLELGESVEFEFSPGATLRYWQLAAMGKAVMAFTATGDLVLMKTDDGDIRWVAPGARGRLGGVRYGVRKFAARAMWQWKTARLSEHDAVVASLSMEAHFDAAHLARRGPCVRCAAEVAHDGTVVVKEGKRILWQGAPPAPSLWQLTTEELYAQSEKTLEPGFRAGAKHALRGIMKSLAARFNLASEDADESGDVEPAASASSTSDSGDSSSWSAAADVDDAAAATAAAAAAPADMPAHAVVAVARGAAATAADVTAHAAALEAHFLAVDRATAFSRDVASTASLDADLRLAADVGDLQEARGAAEDSAEAAAEEVAATSAAAAAAAAIASDMRQRMLQWQRMKEEQQQATPPPPQRRSLRDSCWQWLQEITARAGARNAASAEEAAAHAAAAAAEAKQSLRRVTAEGKRLARQQLDVYNASMLLTGRLQQELFRLGWQHDQQWEAFEHQRQQLQRLQRLQRPEELHRELLRQQQQLDRDRAQRQKQQAKETRLLQKEQCALPRRQRRQQQREERRQRAQQERQAKQQQRQQRRQREAQRRAAEAHEREQQEQRTRQWLQRSAQEHGFSTARGAGGVAAAAQGDDTAAAAAATNPDQFVPLAVLLLFALFRARIGEHRRRTIVAAAAVFVAVHAWALRAALLQHLTASDAYAGMQPGQVYEAATEWVDL